MTDISKRIARRVRNVGLEQMKAVWDAPATFNRKSRRAAGIFGRLWKWDLNVIDPDRATRPPRYVRRHFHSIKRWEQPSTRRQRRAKARILRLMKGRLA